MTPLAAMLHRETGLTLPAKVVERALRQRMAQHAISSEQRYLAQMTADELNALVALVVVPESWFYRDPQAFHAASALIGARLAAQAEATVRVLSIPCAAGEEPYTMAMVLADAGIAPARVSITGIDISHDCIARAHRGLYGQNAFRSQDLTFRTRYFSVQGAQYRISDALRQQVNFRQGNLLSLTTEQPYDVIFCRNLLIYFDARSMSAAIAKLNALLSDDGLLCAGYAEVPTFCQHGYTPLAYPQSFALKKAAALTPLPQQAVAVAPADQRPLVPVPVPVPVPAHAPVTMSARAAPETVPAPERASERASALPNDRLAEARRLADLGQLKAAAQCSRDHLALWPDSAEAYFILGLVNELGQQPQQAEDCWKRCLYLQPDHYHALCHLALLAESLHDTTTAATLKARAARIFQRQQAH